MAMVVLIAAVWIGIGIAALALGVLVSWWSGEDLRAETLAVGLGLTVFGPLLALTLLLFVLREFLADHGNRVVIRGRRRKA